LGIKWIQQGIRKKGHSPMISLCEGGHIDTIKWLINNNLNIDINTDHSYLFNVTCARGHLELAKYLYGIGCKTHKNEDYAFRYACINGHLDVAQWLYGLDQKTDIHVSNDQTFTVSPLSGNLDVMQWLYSLDPTTYNTSVILRAFRCAVRNDKLQIAKWLYQLPIVLTDTIIVIDFHDVCIKGYLETAQWLYSIGSNMKINYNDIFRQCCVMNHIHVAKWLLQLQTTDPDIVINTKFYRDVGNDEVKTWLAEINK
jgi:hypothetical protein